MSAEGSRIGSVTDLRLVDGTQNSARSLPPPHPSVDMSAEDPCRIPGDSWRRCIASRSDGERCGASVPHEERYCAAHAGKLDPSKGGKAKAAKLQAEKDEAHALAVEARLGTRAILARVFQDRHDDVRAIVNGLLDDAKDESLPSRERRACRLALLPFIDQALGKPKEQVELTVPTTVEEVKDLSLSDLYKLRDELRSGAAS